MTRSHLMLCSVLSVAGLFASLHFGAALAQNVPDITGTWRGTSSGVQTNCIDEEFNGSYSGAIVDFQVLSQSGSSFNGEYVNTFGGSNAGVREEGQFTGSISSRGVITADVTYTGFLGGAFDTFGTATVTGQLTNNTIDATSQYQDFVDPVQGGDTCSGTANLVLQRANFVILGLARPQAAQSEPSIELIYVPPIGSFEDLAGQASDVDPSSHAVAVYIRVRGGWWTKPFFSTPKTPIRGDGGWTTDITTGGIDETATEVAAFLISDMYDPPARSGQPELPQEVFDAALARVIEERHGPVSERFQNGGFEEASRDPAAGYFLTLGVGNTDIDGWLVSAGTVDYVGTYWMAQNGNVSIDLNGRSLGSIEQAFRTEEGEDYEVEFYIAGNPDGGPAEKELNVTVGSDTHRFVFDSAGQSRSDMGWRRVGFSFTAEGDVTVLRFTSQIEGAYGPVIDSVRVSRVR